MQVDGIGTIEDTEDSKLMRDVETARDGYGTENALTNLVEKVTNVLITGDGVLITDFEDPSPAETTKNYEEVGDDRGALLQENGCVDATDCTDNSSSVHFETLTTSAVLEERLGRTKIHREEVRSALCTPTIVNWDQRAPRSEPNVRRGPKSTKKNSE